MSDIDWDTFVDVANAKTPAKAGRVLRAARAKMTVKELKSQRKEIKRLRKLLRNMKKWR